MRISSHARYCTGLPLLRRTRPPLYILFFISRNLVITCTGSDSPVARLSKVSAYQVDSSILATYFASGVPNLMNTFHFFSSPIVDFPVVHESLCAFDMRLKRSQLHPP